MRRIPRSDGAAPAAAVATPTAPAPVAPAPVAPPPVAAPAPTVPTVPATVAAPVAHPPAPTGQAGGLALWDGVAGELGKFEVDPRLRLSESQPYIGFYDDRSDRAAEIRAQIPTIAGGTPYLCIGDDFADASGWGFQILREFPHHVELDAAGRSVVGCSLLPQSRNSDLSENVLTVALLLPGRLGLPEGIAPAVCTLTTWRSTKCPAVKQHLGAVRRTLSPDWARQGSNGAIVASVPERYRIASAFKMSSKTARKTGLVYHECSALPATVGLDQLQALNAWKSSPDCQKEAREVLDAYEARVAELEALAASTHDKR